MLPLTVNDSLGQTNLSIPSTLVKVAFNSRFEAARTLVDHLWNGANIFEVETIASDPIHAYIADHKHAKIAFAFRFRTHQPCKHLDIFAIRFNDCHV